MHCKQCGFANGEDDHRCLRCGRRLSGIVIAAPPGYSGANALAPAPMTQTVTKGDTEEFRPAGSVTSGTVSAPEQPPLFAGYSRTAKPSRNVIPFDRPFDRVQREAVSRPPVRPAAVSAPAASRGRKTAANPAQDAQALLDFMPAAPLKGRMLKTTVEAQVFCDLPVAMPIHRFVASAIDAALIMIGFGVLILIYQFFGGSFGSGRMVWISMAGALALVALLYGLIWAIAGRETAGMRATDLHLITFDGFPLDPRSRALRFASAWLSFCSGGLGLLWAVADEENLTWHDHISQTFPTIREAPRTFVKQHR